MQIVIDISEDDYRKVQDGRASVSMMRKTIRNGTPLPKGHGRIGDFDIAEGWLEDGYMLDDVPALLEADDDTCKNVGEDYAEVDQFVCSKCGIELQDWHGVERDMDDEFREEVSYYEYTFRFCPNCGRRIVWGE